MASATACMSGLSGGASMTCTVCSLRYDNLSNLIRQQHSNNGHALAMALASGGGVWTGEPARRNLIMIDFD